MPQPLIRLVGSADRGPAAASADGGCPLTVPWIMTETPGPFEKTLPRR